LERINIFKLKQKLIIIGFIFCQTVFSQSIDSLKNLLKTNINDTTKIIVYAKISDVTSHLNIDESFNYAYKTLSLSKQLNFERGTAEAYSCLGQLHSTNSKDSSLFYLNEAKKLKEKLKDYKGAASIYSSLGNAYDIIGNSDKALKCYISSLRIFDSLKIDHGIGAASMGIGNVFENLKNHKKAIEYYEKSLDAFSRINSPYVSWVISNLANSYENLGQTEKAKGLYEKSLQLKLKNKDYYGTLESYNSLGDLLLKEKKFDESLSYYNHALEIERKYNCEKETFATSYYKIANVLFETNKIALAKRYNDSLGYILNETNLFDYQMRYLLQKSKYYEKISDFENSLLFYKKHVKLKDSLFNLKLTEQIAEADAKYANEKKQKDIELLQKDNSIQQIVMEKHKTQRNGLIIGFSLMFIMLLFIVKGYRQKQKANEVITQQKIDVEQKNSLIEEKQKEILDSIHYAKRIQNTLLAHHDFLNDNIPNNFVYFNPKDIVSGDFYWATKHGNNFYLAVCDSTGHGVPGAFMSLLNIGFLTEAINEKNITETNLIFEYVRERLMSSVSKEGQKDGFDGIIVRFNQSTKEITYTAAHNAPILISNNELIELQKDKMPVGIGERRENFTCHKLQVKQGDVLYLYTDGYADQFGGPKGKKFKYKPLNELLLSISNKTLSEQKQELETNFKNWKGDLEQVDDVCVIGIRI